MTPNLPKLRTSERSPAVYALAVACTLIGFLVFAMIVVRLAEARRTAREAAAVARDHAAQLRELRAEVVALHNTREAITSLQTASELCRQRTESIRGVLEIMIPSGIWPDRVVLPDPPPGWRPWPEGNKHGYVPGG